MTSKTMTRNDFLRLSAGFVGSTAVLGTFGCPAGDDTGSEEGGNDSTGGTTNGTTTETEQTDTSPMTSSSSGEPPGDSSSSGEPGDSSSSGGPGDSGSSDGGMACEGDPAVMIGGHPGHEMVVPLADVEAGVEVVYDIQGASAHPHTVTVTPDDFAALQAGMPVMVESSFDSGHTHMITLSCA